MTFGRVAVLGDSYSTFEGCIPDGYAFYYGSEKHVETGVLRREDTWWDMLLRETGSTLLMNNSYSGSTVCTTVRKELPVSSAFVSRLPVFFDGSTPLDTIFFLGATNDSWIDAPLGEPTLKDWRAYSEEEKKYVLPAVGYTFGYLADKYPFARVVAIVNDGLKPEIARAIVEAAKTCRCVTVELNGVSKIHGHPNADGMKRIKELILEKVKE